MPYKVKKIGEQKWKTYNPDTGKRYGTHETKKEAEKQRRALYHFAPPSEEKK